MTHLRKTMLEELQRRNYAQNTIRHYVRTVEGFARRFHCSPDRLGPRHIREYQAELFQKRKLSANSVRQHLAALRFFYIKTLRRAWSLAETPYPKKTRRLPTVLSREEVTQLIHAARTPGERILLMTLYATGARNSELTHLKVTDIDSQRMVVHMPHDTTLDLQSGRIYDYKNSWCVLEGVNPTSFREMAEYRKRMLKETR